MEPDPLTGARVIVARDFAREAAERVAAVLRDALAARGSAHVAVCGGSTPAAVFAVLADLPLDWARVHVWFGDERCVPPDHADSNYRLLAESLVARLPGDGPVVHRMEGEDPDPSAAAQRYAAELPERLDLALQGVGEDGHTASLFPGAEALDERERRVLFVLGPKPPPERLTLTPPVLAAARHAIVLARGAGKADVARRALRGPRDPHALPVQLLTAPEWIVDEAAASRLEGMGSAGRDADSAKPGATS